MGSYSFHQQFYIDYFLSERMVKETRLYELLKVEPCADDDTLKKKYRELARKYHPDRNPDGAELFKEISLAYATLKDPEKRNLYNVKGEAGLKKPCCKAPAYPDKTATASKKASNNANNVQNTKVLEIGKFKIPTSNNIKRKIGSDGLDGHEIPIKRIFVGNAPFGHDYAAGNNKSGQIHAGHNHSGHSHAGHDHSGHSHASHDHSGHSHAGHDHGHNHFEDEDESEDEEEGEGEGCPCCPAIQMSPAMMQKLMAMQMQMGMYGYGAPGGPAAQMFGYYGRPSGSYITDITEDPQ